MLILLVPMGIMVSLHHMVRVTAQSGLLVAITKALNSGKLGAIFGLIYLVIFIVVGSSMDSVRNATFR